MIEDFDNVEADEHPLLDDGEHIPLLKSPSYGIAANCLWQL